MKILLQLALFAFAGVLYAQEAPTAPASPEAPTPVSAPATP